MIARNFQLVRFDLFSPSNHLGFCAGANIEVDNMFHLTQISPQTELMSFLFLSTFSNHFKSTSPLYCVKSWSLEGTKHNMVGRRKTHKLIFFLVT